jgi:hypothetical protein
MEFCMRCEEIEREPVAASKGSDDWVDEWLAIIHKLKDHQALEHDHTLQYEGQPRR